MMLPKIPTKDAAGNPNGWVLPIWHVDMEQRVDQVYCTAVAAGASKGPHLHKKRYGRFVCLKGDVLIVIRDGDQYLEKRSGEQAGHESILVPPNFPAAIYNVGEGEALVLNMPTPPWRADDQDEHPVEDWSYKP